MILAPVLLFAAAALTGPCPVPAADPLPAPCVYRDELNTAQLRACSHLAAAYRTSDAHLRASAELAYGSAMGVLHAVG